ncbi:MAG: hypothetical protein WKF31_04540 [Thermoleophilaceae bacterium]
MEELAVSRTAHAHRAAVDRRAPVGGGHHVQNHMGSVRRGLALQTEAGHGLRRREAGARGQKGGEGDLGAHPDKDGERESARRSAATRPGLSVELTPGDPHHPPSGDLKRPVAGAIGLEGPARGVKGMAVELDDEALGPPEAVALDQATGDLDVGVDRRPRQSGTVRYGEEALLELAPGGVLADAAGRDDRAESGGAAAAGMAGEKRLERDHVAEPTDLGLLERALELPAR